MVMLSSVMICSNQLELNYSYYILTVLFVYFVKFFYVVVKKARPTSSFSLQKKSIFFLFLFCDLPVFPLILIVCTHCFKFLFHIIFHSSYVSHTSM